MTSTDVFGVMHLMRSRALTLKSRLVGIISGAFLALAAAAIQPVVSTHEAAAETEISVGTLLQALDNVPLSRAEIAKGSRVSVTKLLTRQGDLSSVDLVLADGQVIRKVAIGTIRAFFRVVNGS